jgi:nitrogen-specific signal transduction histidine kinase
VSGAAGALERLPIGAAVVTDEQLVAANDAFARVLRTTPDRLAGTRLGDLLAPEDAELLVRRLTADPDVAHLADPDPGDGDGDPPPAAEPAWLPVAGVAPDTAPWTGQLTVGDGVGSEAGAGCIALLVPGSPTLSISTTGQEPPLAGPDGPWDRIELDRVLSHDARGGLRGVKSFLTLLERELGDALAGQSAEFYATAASAATRTDLMLERLVALLRLSIRPLTLTPVAVEDVLLDVVTRSTDAFPGEAPALVAGSLPRVWANRTLLVEALAELVTNARKFADGPVELRLTAEQVGRWAYLCLHDDGPGVEPSLAEDAFTPFRLLQPKGRYPGVGMGLPTVRESLRAQGGHCWIDASDGPGTTVRCRLALATPDPSA